MKINKNVINLIKRNAKNFKDEKLKENKILQKEFYTSFKNYEKNLEERTSYETALWIDSNEQHLKSLCKKNLTNYKLGTIVNVDLGWNNYDGEFAYIHPAIVIDNKATKIFIVPCTSGEPRKDKKGQVYPEYCIGTIKDGFKKDSVVMLQDARYIDKNRVISILGETTPEFFDKIYNKVFEEIFEPKKYQLDKLLKNSINNS